MAAGESRPMVSKSTSLRSRRRIASKASTGSATNTNKSGGKGIASCAAPVRSSTTWLTTRTNRASWSPCPTSFSPVSWSRPAKAKSIYGRTTAGRSLSCGSIWPAGAAKREAEYVAARFDLPGSMTLERPCADRLGTG